jgi:hypothetical protein
MRETVSLFEGAELELRSAEAKLAHAHDALHQFIREKCFLVDDRPVLTGPPAKRGALESEFRELQLSHEAAVRKVQEAQQLCADLKG